MEESDLIEDLVAKGASDEEIDLLIQYFRANKKTSPGVVETAAAGVGAFNRGISKVVSEPLKTLGRGLNWLQSKVTGEEVAPGPLETAGEKIQQFTEDINPYNPNVNETYQAVGEGLGQGVGMLMSGGTGAAPALASKAPTLAGTVASKLLSKPAIIGGSMTAAPEWEAAKAAGMDDDQAFESLVKNYLVGTTEAIPVTNLINRLNKLSGNRILETVKNMGIGALEEYVQEFTQTYATNQFAKDDYDPDRDPMFEVLESAKVGGIVGAILPGIGTLSQRLPAEKRVKVQQRIKEMQADKAIASTSTGDAEIDAEIDAAAIIAPQEKAFIEAQNVSQAVEEEKVDVEKKVSEIEKEADQVAKEATDANKPKPKEGAKPTPKSVEPDPRAVAEQKLQELMDKLVNAEPGEEEALYRELSATKQALRQIAGPAKSPAKTDIQKQIEKTVGVSKQDPIVVKNPAVALKEQIKQHYRTLEEGIRTGQKMTNENLIKRVQETVKETDLSPKQINTILTKVRKTNLFTPGSQSKLNDFIAKVTEDADYANKLEEARTLNKKIRKLAKSRDIEQNYRPVAKKFASIPVDETFLSTHLDWGNKILAGLSSPKTDRYSAFNTDEASDYVEKTLADVEEYATKDEPQPTTAQEDPDQKLRASLKFAIDSLNDKDLSDFDESEKSVINSIKNLDINSLDSDQLKTAIRVADNIVENDDLSNTGKIEAVIKAKRNLKLLAAETKDVVKKDVKGVGRVIGNIYQQFGRVFGDSGIASRVQQLTGIMDLFNAGSRVENMEVKLAKKLRDTIDSIEKQYKTEINDTNNQVKLVAFSELYKNYGDDSHIPKVKRNIERTISEYEKAGETEDANAWKRAYSEFKDVATVADAEAIMKKTPGLFEVWKFFNNTFNTEVSEKLAKITTEHHNEVYRPANNYTHTRHNKVNTVAAETLISDATGGSFGINAKQANTSKTATRGLSPGSAYASNFTDTQLRGYRESMYDIEAAKSRALVYEVFKSPEFEEIVGGKDNADLIRKMVIRGQELQNAMNRPTANDAVRFLNEFSGVIRNIGSVRALASVMQPFKQVPSVVTRALFNHVGTGSVGSLMQSLGAINLVNPNPNLKRLFDQYTIGVRGERLGGIERGEAQSRKISGQSRKLATRLAEKIKMKQEDLSRIFLQPLTKSDVYAARATWLSYYLQSLKEQGVKDIDVNKEYQRQIDPKRQQAAAFAEQKIAETQVPSNPATLAQLSRNENDGGWNFAKNILLPFSTFSINAKYRMIQDFERAVRTPNIANAAAVGGDAAEIAVYGGVAYGLATAWKPFLKTIIEKMTGVDAPEEDEKVTQAKRDKAIQSLLVNQVSPIAIGTLGESATAHLANQIARIIQNPDQPYTEWKKETGGFVYEPDALDMGLFSLGLEPVSEGVSNAMDLYDYRTGNPIEYDSFGHTKQANINDNQASILMLKTLLDITAVAGIGEADVYNQIRKIYKEQLKASTGTPVKSTRRRRIQPKRN